MDGAGGGGSLSRGFGLHGGLRAIGVEVVCGGHALRFSFMFGWVFLKWGGVGVWLWIFLIDGIRMLINEMRFEFSLDY